jgi:heptosyltransferase II
MTKPVDIAATRRVLVVLPSWLGDAVMATPTLRALRGLCPESHITALVKHNLRPVVDGVPWVNRVITIRPKRRGMADGRRAALFGLARRIGAGNFDAAILLPNSFRMALLVRMAGIPRRIGYDRDGRGGLLTDRLLPRRISGRRFLPMPTRDYYLGIARFLGASDPDPTMQIFTRADDDQRADQLLSNAGYQPAGGRPLVLINPGANYGDAKIWPPDRFVAVADRCATEFGAVIAVSGSPKERPILDQVIGTAKHAILDLPKMGVDLRLLKSVVKRATLMITNDTGPRHIAAAMGLPVVTIFGPTDPAWSETHFEAERQVMVQVFCGPCQKKHCPLDHRCMTLIGPDMVFARAAELLRAVGAAA